MKKLVALIALGLATASLVSAEEQIYTGNDYHQVNAIEDSPAIKMIGLVSVQRPNNTTSLCTGAIIGPKHVLTTYRCLSVHDAIGFEQYWKLSEKGRKSVFSEPSNVTFSRSLLGVGGDHQNFKAKKIHYLEVPGVIDPEDNDTMGFGSVIIEFEKEISKNALPLMEVAEFDKYREGNFHFYGYKRSDSGEIGLFADGIGFKRGNSFFDTFSMGNQTLNVQTFADSYSSIMTIEDEGKVSLVGIQLGKMSENTGFFFKTEEKPYFRFMYPIFVKWANSIIKK